MVLFAPREPRKLKCMSNIREIELEEKKSCVQIYMAKPGEVERKWYVVDATDVPMGRLSAVVASILRGKINQHSHLMWIQVIS